MRNRAKLRELGQQLHQKGTTCSVQKYHIFSYFSRSRSVAALRHGAGAFTAVLYRGNRDTDRPRKYMLNKRKPQSTPDKEERKERDMRRQIENADRAKEAAEKNLQRESRRRAAQTSTVHDDTVKKKLAAFPEAAIFT